MKYVVVIVRQDKKYEDFNRHYYREFDNYRDLRDFLVKQVLQDEEYTVFQETKIKIKKIRGYKELEEKWKSTELLETVKTIIH